MNSHSGRSLLALAAALLPPTSASAQNVEVGIDGLAGIVRDDRNPGDNEDFSGGVLPSLAIGTNLIHGQVDGLLFDYAGDSALGGALHLGPRIGEHGYIGIYGSLSELERHTGLTTKRVGGEAKLGLGVFSIEGIAGYEHTEQATFLIGTTATHDVYDVYGRGGKFFSFSDLKMRPSGSLVLSVGHRYTGGRHAAAAGVAIGFGNNIALLLQGRAGGGDYKMLLGGLRVRFGGRTDGSPSSMLENRLIEDLFAAGNTRRQLLVPLPPPPSPPEEEGCGSCGGYCDA